MDNCYFIILSIIVIFYVINVVRKKELSVKESFWWFLASILMLLLSIFPYSIDWVATKLGIAYPPALLFVLCIIFLLFLLFRHSRRISDLQMKVIELGQEVAVLKEKVNHEKKTR